MNITRIIIIAAGLILMAACTSNSSDQGLGLRLPDLRVEGRGQIIANNDTSPTTADGTNFGAVLDEVSQTFTLRNNGNEVLTLASTPISISGSDAFSVEGQPDALVLSPNQSTTFIISANTTDLNPREEVTASVTVNATGLQDDITFDISAIQGSSLVIYQIVPGTPNNTEELVIEDSTVDFGTNATDSTIRFRVRNLGTTAFDISDPSLSSSNNGANGVYTITQLSGITGDSTLLKEAPPLRSPMCHRIPPQTLISRPYVPPQYPLAPTFQALMP